VPYGEPGTGETTLLANHGCLKKAAKRVYEQDFGKGLPYPFSPRRTVRKRCAMVKISPAYRSDLLELEAELVSEIRDLRNRAFAAKSVAIAASAKNSIPKKKRLIAAIPAKRLRVKIINRRAD
jgi:hypothetical protein